MDKQTYVGRHIGKQRKTNADTEIDTQTKRERINFSDKDKRNQAFTNQR